MNLLTLADKYGTDKGGWQGFCPAYEKYLPPTRSVFTMVELGVQQGNSIAMWEEWFPYAKIIGIDIDITQVKYPFSDPRIELIQGKQDDYILAESLTAFRKPKVVIDDASHISQHTIEAFHAWWKHLKPGGLYVIEDTHCSYDTKHYGNESAGVPPRLACLDVNQATTMNFLKRLADDVNWNHHDHNRFQPIYKDIAYVHFYPGICFIGKK